MSQELSIRIEEYINQRKALWLKGKRIEEREKADMQFDIANWIQNASKRATLISMVTHHGKFTHPKTEASGVIASCSQSNDGYIRSGNLNYNFDVYGNAAGMDVYKFLMLSDGEQSVLDAFEKNDESLKKYIKNLGLDFESLKDSFLQIKFGSKKSKTDKSIKQIYFPVGEDNHYRILSILTPSGLLKKLNEEISNMLYSDESKEFRHKRKENIYTNKTIKTIPNLTLISYGGSKPQNISTVAVEIKGKSYLLPSLPPVLNKRDIRLPTKSFFSQCLNRFDWKYEFQLLHKYIKTDINNMAIREAMYKVINMLIDQIIYKAKLLRSQSNPGWSQSETYAQLPNYEKFWLDAGFVVPSEGSFIQNSKSAISEEISRWIILSYEKFNQKQIILGKIEFEYIKKMVGEQLQMEEELGV